MKWSGTFVTFAACLVITVMIDPSRTVAGKDVCFDDWSVAGPVVRAEKLLSVAEVLASVKKRGGGKIVKVQLCGREATYHYRVSMTAIGGRLVWLNVDAKSGRITPLVRP